MSYTEQFVDNNGVRIHCLEFNADMPGIPLIMVPGMINSAEEVAHDVGPFLTHHTIVLSLRGRGKSDSPPTGWTLQDQASDIAAIIQFYGFEKVVLFGHSTGGSIAARALPMISAEVTGFIIGDFAPFSPPYDTGWRDHILSLADRQISDAALHGLVADAKYEDVSGYLESVRSRLLVLTGEEDSSVLNADDIERLRAMYPELKVEKLNGCSHEFLSDDPKQSMRAIEQFLARVEGTDPGAL